MKAKEKILITLIGITLLLAILIPIKSNAALQANGKSASTKLLEQWINEVREMEAQGGTLGLTGSASLKQQLGSNGKVANSNNLDIHMQKNTEYGAMAILSASNYGKPNPVHVTNNGSLSTTTGNKSGVYMSLNFEYVAAGIIQGLTIYQNSDLKYKNIYDANTIKRIPGDATLETAGWHRTNNSVASGYFKSNDNRFLRANSGSIFSYSRYEGYLSPTAYRFYKPYYSRAVIVIGNGF